MATESARTGKSAIAGKPTEDEAFPKNSYREVRRYVQNPLFSGFQRIAEGGQTDVPFYYEGS